MPLKRRQLMLPLAVSTACLLLPKSDRIKLPSLISQSKFDQEKVYQQFLEIASSSEDQHPVLLFQGVDKELEAEIRDYPQRLQQQITCLDYPSIGEIPPIDEDGLEFLHPEIKEACLCIGSYQDGKLSTKWLGKNALSNQEFWSATKFIPLLNLICRSNCDVNHCQIRGLTKYNQLKNINFHKLAKDLMTYQKKIASSNALAATLKRFQPQIKLEKWVQNITGNHDSIFRGRYGEPPFINQPELYNSLTENVVLTPDKQEPNWGDNSISAYDLTRLISQIGWHYYLQPSAKLPGINDSNLDSLIQIMGFDTARFTERAIAILGLEKQLDSLVVLSKQGYGVTTIRKRTEAVYVALIQFNYQQQLFTLGMTLKSALALQPRDVTQELVRLEARLTTEITEIIRRVTNMK